jgi:AbrB family looped-hinge helix DNA binding protein
MYVIRYLTLLMILLKLKNSKQGGEPWVPRPEIMKKLNIKTSQQLTVAYAKAMMDMGKIPVIKGGRGGAADKEGNVVTVGKRGSVIIPKDMAESLGVAVGDKFSVRRTKAGIALKKV